MLNRIPGALLALAAHAALAVTVWFLFPFLQGLRPPPEAETSSLWWLIDILLVLQFCVPHSLLLAPPVRDRLERRLPSALHGCLFCLTTCLSLLLLIGAWQRTPIVVWRLDGWARSVVCGAYFLSWGGAALRPGPDRLRLADGLDAVLGVVPRRAAAAPPLRAARRLSLVATSGLSGFPGANLADADGHA